MTLSPELREPTSYKSEPVEPHVPEMEIVNDYSRFLLHKGEPLSLQGDVDTYIRLFEKVSVNFQPGAAAFGRPVSKQIQEIDRQLVEKVPEITGLYPGRPVMIGEQTGFVSIPKSKQDRSDWAIVPDSWQLHGQLGQAKTLYIELNGRPVIVPGFYLLNPYFITEGAEILDLSEQLTVMLVVSQVDAPLMEGVNLEPSMRDIEL